MINNSKGLTMKPLYLFLLSVLLTGCLKADIAPVPLKNNASSIKTDTVAKTINTVKADTVNNNTIAQTDTSDANYWYNGTKGTALIQVTCADCTAIATIGDVSTPFLFNKQGVGLLKYTPASGLSVHIAVCPGSTKTMKVDIFDATNASLYTYSGVSGNWINTYVIK
jgi:hypothetical protein